jgi:hypothetical protein
MINFFSSLRSKQETVNSDYDGTLSGTYDTQSFTQSSSIDPEINDLTFKTVYDLGVSRIPILVLMHGWSGTELSFEQSTYQRFAYYGFFVLGVNMRKPKDASGRELHDVIDAVQKVKADFNNLIDPNRVCVSGYSGGGGNVLGLYVKFPDYFNLYISHFGMSDYGFTVDGWYQTNPSYQAGIETAIGGTPSLKPNEYRSRNSRQSILNFNLLAELIIYHDEDDPEVDILQSSKLNDLIGVNDKFIFNRSQTGDVLRWIHGYPRNGFDIIQAESDWKQKVFDSSPVNAPNTGTIVVSGFMVTKQFSIWLGDGTSSNDGTNRSASIQYDLLNRTYIVDPIFETGATDCVVTISQGVSTVQQTINSQTTFNL